MGGLNISINANVRVGVPHRPKALACIPLLPTMLTLCSRRQRFICVLVPVLVLSVHTLVYISQNSYQVRNFFSYLTRPVWDTPDGPRNIIPHYYAEGLPLDQDMCSLHDWKERGVAGGRTVQVLDAVLMSSELDLLEIRLNELDSVVDWFFIVESNATFTGLPKEKYYDKNKERFEKFAHKIKYRRCVFDIALDA